MPYKYEELGLSNTKAMFDKALDEGFAVPGYNFNNMEQLQAIVTACAETGSPVILQVSKGARTYANSTMLTYMAQGAVKMVREELKSDIPIALHLDHGGNFEICKACIDSGFSSVMFDGSSLPYEENIKVTQKVVEYAHARGVSVEAELGVLAGIEDEVQAEKSTYTDPDQVVDFVTRTGCDSLAISIGTSHGAYKFKVDRLEDVPPLRIDILKDIRQKLGRKYPIVLHGSSSVLQEYVKIINENGGNLEKAFGVREDQIREATKHGVAKVNIDSDGRLVMTAMIRKILKEQPKVFDPRKYLGPARDELIKMMKRKNAEVLGCAGAYIRG
ncbi:MAG: class II fructose-1,6-bisphosphate aldolase [Promethearchaeia archaeon]|nr:MAG: class II fructose-1,6-bisphosphate aldolase [Candidatus Lokiarchaeia archaeon]